MDPPLEHPIECSSIAYIPANTLYAFTDTDAECRPHLTCRHGAAESHLPATHKEEVADLLLE
jgi:hypothetical protein